MTWKGKLVLFFTSILICVELVFYLLGLKVSVNISPSLPYKFFIVDTREDKIKNIKSGDFIQFKNKNTKYYNGINITKQILAKSGDVLEVNSFELPKNNVQGTIRFKNIILEVKDKSMFGTKMSMNDVTTIPDNKFFVIGFDKNSFDSRYKEFGLIDELEVIGVAKPLFKHYFSICSLCLFFLCLKVNAKDLGIHGSTFDIQEQDLLEYIENKLTELDIVQWQNEFKIEVKKSINRPRSIILPYAKKYRVYYYNPSIVLQKDYMDNTGVVFAKKGTTVNPLDNVVLSKDLIFIDGDNQQQVDYAIDYLNKKNGKVKIILTNGPILDLVSKKNVRFYFDQHGILVKKLRVENIPAIVSQDNKLLKIEEVVLNYD